MRTLRNITLIVRVNVLLMRSQGRSGLFRVSGSGKEEDDARKGFAEQGMRPLLS